MRFWTTSGCPVNLLISQQTQMDGNEPASASHHGPVYSIEIWQNRSEPFGRISEDFILLSRIYILFWMCDT